MIGGCRCRSFLGVGGGRIWGVGSILLISAVLRFWEREGGGTEGGALVLRRSKVSRATRLALPLSTQLSQG